MRTVDAVFAIDAIVATDEPRASPAKRAAGTLLTIGALDALFVAISGCVLAQQLAKGTFEFVMVHGSRSKVGHLVGCQSTLKFTCGLLRRWLIGVFGDAA